MDISWAKDIIIDRTRWDRRGLDFIGTLKGHYHGCFSPYLHSFRLNFSSWRFWVRIHSPHFTILFFSLFFFYLFPFFLLLFKRLVFLIDFACPLCSFLLRYSLRRFFSFLLRFSLINYIFFPLSLFLTFFFSVFLCFSSLLRITSSTYLLSS